MDLTMLMTPERLADPYPLYAQLRAMDPVFRAPGAFGVGAWIVTGHALCSQLLRSKQMSKEGDRVLPPEVLAKIPQEGSELAARRKDSMLFRDPPAHTRLRGLVNQAFTPRTVERLRPHIAEIAEQLLDATAPTFDLIAELAFPLPIIVISELLGVPPADRDQFKAWSTDVTRGLEPNPTPEVLAEVARALDALDGYMTGVIEERRRSPRADLISDLVSVHEAGDRLSMGELLATCRLILTAGHETTVNLIGNGVLALLRNPAQRDVLVADPSRIPDAIEEMLRYDSPVQMTLRFALEDMPLGRHAVKRGDLVVILVGAGNRDPDVFADPERFDVCRPNAHQHLAFGAGIHYCLGAPLARLEGEIAIGALLRRRPGLTLADTPTHRRNVVLRGVVSLVCRNE